MNKSEIIYAPRPIKHYKNHSGIKIETLKYEYDTQHFTSHTVKAKKVIDWSMSIFPVNSKMDLRKSFLQCLNEPDMVDIDFKEELKEENVKSEILSILNGSESTLYASNISSFDSALNKYKSELFQKEDNFCERIDIRTSMPPLRSQNPFFKNFIDNENLEDSEINLVQFNSKCS